MPILPPNQQAPPPEEKPQTQDLPMHPAFQQPSLEAEKIHQAILAFRPVNIFKLYNTIP